MSPPPTPAAPIRDRLLQGTLARAFLENIPDLIYFKDRESRYLAVSASMLRLHGLASVQDMLGKRDADFLPARYAERFRADEEHILRTGEGFEDRIERIDWDDGRVTWCSTTKQALRDDQGAIVGTLGVTKDITAEKELEGSLEGTAKELADASRLAGMAEVANGVLHNVGNVLSSLNVSANVIAGALRQSKAPSLSTAVELLRQHAGQVGAFVARDPKGALIPDFLVSLARALAEERGQMLHEAESLRKNIDHIKEIVAMQQAYASTAGVLEPLSATTLMEDSLRMNGVALARHDVTVVREFADVPPVWAERGKVLQILINLIRNAKYAVDEGPAPDRRIVLRIEPAGAGRVRLAVQDNGVGIPAENLTRIFAHGFTTRRGGHGFGLHSSALAAREMGGSLTARSAGPGQGATFELELPAAQNLPQATAA